MEFTNSFTVAAPVETVFATLQDVEAVAPCVPGAEITDRLDERRFKGSVKVKLGAVHMTFRGELEMMCDTDRREIVLSGRGQEVRGGSGASGAVTARLASNDDGGTVVDLLSRVDVSGRLAQFGRSIIPEVAGRLIREFAACLESTLTDASTAPGAGGDALDIGGVTADVMKARASEFVRNLTRRGEPQ